MSTFKKIVGSLALGAILTTTIGVTGFAQNWPRNDQSQQRRSDRDYGRDDRDDDRRNNDRYDRRGHRHDNRRDNDRYDRRNGGYNDQYENNSYARKEIEKGYRKGLEHGRKDMEKNRRRTPNDYSQFRDGNQYYRQGYERGFYEAYNQYGNNGRGRRW